MNKEKPIEQIIREAFAKGEEWGVTYSTWFTPTTEKTEMVIQAAIKEIIGDKACPFCLRWY